MKYDRDAPATIKQLHVNHRGRMERQVAQGLETNYKRLFEASTSVLDQWWERAINRPNGVGYTTRFAEKLLAKLEWYQEMMENEAKEEQERLKALNFKAIEEQIREATSAWIRAENRVKAACENYKGLVDRECDLYLQVERRNKAAELYGALRAQAQDVLRRCERIRFNLEGAMKILERNYLSASTMRGGDSPFEHVVDFDPEANRPEIRSDDFIEWHTRERNGIDSWVERTVEEVLEEVEGFVIERYKPLTGLSIDEVLRRSGKDVIAQNLNQLSRLAVPLWNYNEGKIPVVNRGIINELFIYGVPDADKSVLRTPEIAGRVPRGTTDPNIVSTLDQHRVTLFKVKVGVPLFALQGIEEMERAYNDPDKVVSNHLHKKWDSFPNLIPRSGEGEALRLFAIAHAPSPFGLITRRGEWYYIRSQQARRTDGGELRLGQGRLNAYSAFEKNRELVKEVEEKLDAITRTEGEMKISAVLREHIEQLASQVLGGNVDSSIKEQVEGEIQAIEDHLKRMGTIR
jgi:hypothetical protein